MPELMVFLASWAGPTLAFAMFALAFRLRSSALGAIAAATSIPFCAFASGYPIIGGIAWIALSGNLLGAYFINRRQHVAFAALTPFAAVCLFLAVLAIRGIRLVR